MKLPLNWLSDYVDISDISVEDLKNKLFSCGFEVEEVIENGTEMNVFINTEYINAEYDENITIEETYEYLKTLDKYKGAEDI